MWGVSGQRRYYEEGRQEKANPTRPGQENHVVPYYLCRPILLTRVSLHKRKTETRHL